MNIEGMKEQASEETKKVIEGFKKSIANTFNDLSNELIFIENPEINELSKEIHRIEKIKNALEKNWNNRG